MSATRARKAKAAAKTTKRKTAKRKTAKRKTAKRKVAERETESSRSAKKAPVLSVVVPVYDNAATLAEFVARLVRVVDEMGVAAEVVFVDDGSSDSSRAILDQLAAADGRLRVYSLERNFGGQAALCAGFDLVRGQRTVCLDADLENLPEDIPLLLDALDLGHDLACGVREGREGSLSWRGLASRILNGFVRRHLDKPVRDVGCGMRAMETRVIAGLESEGERRRLLTPLMVERARSVVEVPIRSAPAPAAGGHSFLSLFAIATDYYLLSAKRPFLVAGLLAAATSTLGVVVSAAALVSGAWSALIAGLVLAVGGGAGMSAALAGEYAQRLYQLAQGRPLYELASGDDNEKS